MTQPNVFIRSRVARRLSLCCALAVVSNLVLLRPCSGTLSQTGKWTPINDWGNIAIHMALLPGDGNPDHSRILWWTTERFGVFSGGQWGWSPGAASCDSFPSSLSQTFRGVPLSGVDIFCAGNTQILGPHGSRSSSSPGERTRWF